MLDVDRYEEYKLSDIYNEANEEVRKIILNLRSNDISIMATDRIAKKIIEANYNESIITLSQLLDYAYSNNTSNIYFPNDICCFYPYIKEHVTTKDITCDFSCAKIGGGGDIIYIDLLSIILQQERLLSLSVQ